MFPRNCFTHRPENNESKVWVILASLRQAPTRVFALNLSGFERTLPKRWQTRQGWETESGTRDLKQRPLAKCSTVRNEAIWSSIYLNRWLLLRCPPPSESSGGPRTLWSFWSLFSHSVFPHMAFSSQNGSPTILFAPASSQGAPSRRFDTVSERKKERKKLKAGYKSIFILYM